MGVLAQSHDAAWRMANLVFRHLSDRLSLSCDDDHDDHENLVKELYAVLRLELERLDWQRRREQQRLKPLTIHRNETPS